MKVLISGYYGFGNLGDEALLAGMLGGLTDQQVTVLSHKPEETRALHNVAAAHRVTGLYELLRYDALISGGGGLLQDKTSTRSLQYYLGVIALAKRLGKRVVVYGQSVGPLSAAGERAVAKTLQGLPVAVRDEPSQILLDRLGVPAALVADAALLLPKPTVTLQTDAPVLFIPRGGLPAVTDAFIKLARRMSDEDVPVAGLALQSSEDEAALTHLLEAVPALTKLSATTPHEALTRVAESRYLVSARLHGLIFAARAERPSSGVAYDPKVAAFLTALGRPIHSVTPDPDALYGEIQASEVQACERRPHVDSKKIEALTAKAEAGLEWLRGQLGG